MRKQSEQGEWLTMWLERTGFCMGADGVGLHAHQGLQPHKGWELWEGNEPGGDKIEIRHRFLRSSAAAGMRIDGRGPG